MRMNDNEHYVGLSHHLISFSFSLNIISFSSYYKCDEGKRKSGILLCVLSLLKNMIIIIIWAYKSDKNEESTHMMWCDVMWWKKRKEGERKEKSIILISIEFILVQTMEARRVFLFTFFPSYIKSQAIIIIVNCEWIRGGKK